MINLDQLLQGSGKVFWMVLVGSLWWSKVPTPCSGSNREVGDQDPTIPFKNTSLQ